MNTTSSAYSVTIGHVGPVPVTVAARGDGQPFLLLHGGGGPLTVGGFAQILSETGHARVFTPTHPGFGGTVRPEALNSIQGLAQLYGALLDELGLNDVTVVGNSIGGWIAAEMGLLGSPRIGRIVLVNAVGIEVPGHPVANIFALTADQVTERAYHEPDKFRIDFSAMSPAQQAVMAGNRTALAVYGGNPSVGDSTLRSRLAEVTVPTLVVWGESDRMVDQDYGRAYAQAIPSARFELLPASGHLPQIETPQVLLSSILEFSATSS